MKLRVPLLLLTVAGAASIHGAPARAETQVAVVVPVPPDQQGPAEDGPAPAEHLRPQLQLDLGLSVVAAAYEHPIGDHLAIQVEAGIFGTYFLPWFDLGDDVKGVGGGVRPTWFARTIGRGFYVAPYVRVERVSGTTDAGESGTGVAVAGGVFAGWAFGLTERLDLRVGGGAQYIYLDAGPLSASTPFVALDLVVGYRL